MDKKDVIARLKGVGLLSDIESDYGFIDIGSYAINYSFSGKFEGGIPIGKITQIKGDSSTAKTVFLTGILSNAQKAGYYTCLCDAENAYSKSFGVMLGINPDNLIYDNGQVIEDVFGKMESIILDIRKEDKDTPIVIGLDSLAVCVTRKESEAETYESGPTEGAIRAKLIGNCLRKINPLLIREKVALIIINQLRSKLNVMYGDPDTNASGGRSLTYYLAIDAKTSAPKSKRIEEKDTKKVIGIRGTLKNTKNKVYLPFQSADFELYFDKGLTRTYGMLPLLVEQGLVEQNRAWYKVGETKFQGEDKFFELLRDVSISDFNNLRSKLSFLLQD